MDINQTPVDPSQFGSNVPRRHDPKIAKTDAQGTENALRGLSGAVREAMHALDDRLRLRMQGAAKRRQPGSGLTTFKQRTAELGFQALNLLAQRRLRHMHAFGRLTEVQQLAEGGKSGQIAKLHLSPLEWLW